ncbi:hypothetical protein SAMN00120144_1035 [Hymenobacter roseosalivarius DSM 11622]|uniref:Uncharacterized protein n=1 Tax=Hymenobacter roseosalivarius DSM 11622 TaxID=645990 RepID=A0A1W1VY55_9BACT|nr:hypothetical protein SAMN00120144_1035 [Hymenobacter roseosalivarius DSM 11622]
MGLRPLNLPPGLVLHVLLTLVRFFFPIDFFATTSALPIRFQVSHSAPLSRFHRLAGVFLRYRLKKSPVEIAKKYRVGVQAAR